MWIRKAVLSWQIGNCRERKYERGRSFLEPKKEPKKAAFVAVNAAGFPPTGFNACRRSLTRPASLAARCAKRTAEHRKTRQARASSVCWVFSVFWLSGNLLERLNRVGGNKFLLLQRCRPARSVCLRLPTAGRISPRRRAGSPHAGSVPLHPSRPQGDSSHGPSVWGRL